MLKIELQIEEIDASESWTFTPMDMFQVTKERELKIGSDCAGLMEGSFLLKASSQAKPRWNLY